MRFTNQSLAAQINTHYAQDIHIYVCVGTAKKT